MRLISQSASHAIFSADFNSTLGGEPHHYAIDETWFDPEFWLAQNKVYAQKKGRATAYFFQHHALKAVLRHYWRGGLVGKLLSDQYLYFGIKNTRVYREFALLCHLQQQGLPVPSPIAAYIKRSGIIYRGDIITQAIENAVSLCELLTQNSLTQKQLEAVGKCIGEFHRAGVYHADLNINNILFSGDKVYLIDFDRGELRTAAKAWQQQNMARLARSFTKEASRQNAFYWQADHWQMLLNAYEQALIA